jgi:hypothetical protein
VKLWKKILIGLIIAFVFFTGIDIIFNTSILYNQVSDEPIKVYWACTPVQHAENHTSSEFANVGEYHPPKYVINDLTLSVNNPLSSKMGFQINCGNYTQNVDFLTSDGSSLNLTKAMEYRNANSPDIMVTCPLIDDGNFSSWIQLWQQYQKVYPYQPLTKQLTKPFLTQTSFDTWEGQFRFDNSFGMIPLFNETFNLSAPLNYGLFLKANVSQISFKITLPNYYQVQNPSSVNIEGIPTTPINTQNQFIVSKNITAGETFDLRIIDTSLEPWQSALGFIGNIGISSVVISIGADLLIQYFVKKQSNSQHPVSERNKPKKSKPKKGRHGR